jgi:predicted CopG family antitoxin
LRPSEVEKEIRYVHAHVHTVMTKVISLSEKAYAELKKRKGREESFSDVVLRIIENRESGSLLKFAGVWAGREFDAIEKDLTKQREESASREYDL